MAVETWRASDYFEAAIKEQMVKVLLLVAATWNLMGFGTEYRDPKGRFQFDYPEANWEVGVTPTTSAKESVDVTMAEQVLVTVQRKVADDKYRARFGVVLDNAAKVKSVAAAATPEAKLEAYRKHATDFMKSQRFDILSNELKSFQGKQAFEVVANQRDFGLTFKQVGFLIGNEAYLLTATTRTAKFEAYAAEIGNFFSSFKLRN